MNRPGQWRGGSPSDQPFAPPLLKPDDDVSLDAQRGIETLETMLFIEAVYRRYFGDDPTARRSPISGQCPMHSPAYHRRRRGQRWSCRASATFRPTR
jgi:hypothetical protein